MVLTHTIEFYAYGIAKVLNSQNSFNVQIREWTDYDLVNSLLFFTIIGFDYTNHQKFSLKSYNNLTIYITKLIKKIIYYRNLKSVIGKQIVVLNQIYMIDS